MSGLLSLCNEQGAESQRSYLSTRLPSGSVFTVSITTGRSPTLPRNATGVGWTTVELLGVQGRNNQSSLFATRGPTHIHSTPIAHTVERLLSVPRSLESLDY